MVDSELGDENLRRMVAGSRDATMILSAANVVLFANEAALALFDGRLGVGDNFGVPLAREPAVELDVPRADGSVEVVEMRVGATEWCGEPARVVTLRDVTERAGLRESMAKLNRVLRAVRMIGQLIAREKDAESLCRRACELMAQTGGYTGALVAMIDGEGGLGVIAHSVLDRDDPERMAEELRAFGLTQCMRAAAADTDRPVARIEANAACTICPLAESVCVGQRLVAPLEHGGRFLGVVVVSLPAGVTWSCEEIDLIDDMARDLAYGLSGIQNEQARRRSERDAAFANRVLQRLAAPRSGARHLGTILDIIQEYGDCEAVAIRTQDGDEFPAILRRDVSDTHGAKGPARAGCTCMCATVFGGHTDPQSSCFTPAGSFWTGDATTNWPTATVAAVGKSQAVPCAGHGYRSVAVIPLRAGKQTIGVLQLEDQRPQRFTAEMIGFLEELGAAIGIAMHMAEVDKARADSEARHRALFEGSRDALLTLDPSTARFTSCNAATLALFGMPAEREFIGRTIADLSPPEQPDGSQSKRRVQAKVQAALETDEPPFEWTFERADGQTFPATVLLARNTSSGQTFLQATIRDETEVKQLHASIAQSDRLASLGMLAAGVAHEINNPLTYVLDNLEGLSAELPRLAAAVTRLHAVAAGQLGHDGWATAMGPDSAVTSPMHLDELRAQAAEALQGTRRIRALARGLGTFSRVDPGELVPVDIGQVLDVAINLAFNEIKYRARLTKDYRPTALIMASEGRLAQVFLNLLINAAHAIGDGQVATDEVRVKTWQESGNVYAEVSDTGRGITQADLANIFKPFFTTKPAGAGTGLGLPISLGIIQQYGGTIEVRSEVGRGTAFVVKLPVRVAAGDEPTELATLAAPETEARWGRVLVVDDEAPLRTMIARILAGHDVVTAASGADAQAILRADQGFDAILCDLMMPAMSGVELHKWLTDANPELADKVVFVSGGAFTAGIQGYLAAVGNTRLNKPFNKAELLRVVAELVDVSKSRGESRA